MEFTLYIGSKKVKHAIGYIYWVKMHAQDFQEPKGDIIWIKDQVNQEVQRVYHNKRLSKLYLRIKLTRSWFQSSTSEQSKTNEQN